MLATFKPLVVHYFTQGWRTGQAMARGKYIRHSSWMLCRRLSSSSSASLRARSALAATLDGMCANTEQCRGQHSSASRSIDIASSRTHRRCSALVDEIRSAGQVPFWHHRSPQTRRRPYLLSFRADRLSESVEWRHTCQTARTDLLLKGNKRKVMRRSGQQGYPDRRTSRTPTLDVVI